MEPLLVALIVFVVVFGGALAGLTAGRWLPTHHQNAETRDAVKLVMGLIATIAALVLSLLIASAHSAYDTQEREVRQLGAHISELNAVLLSYGPEADGIRAELRRLGEAEVARIWREAGAAPTSTLGPSHGEAIFQKLAALTPKDELQRFAQTRALQIATTMDGTRRLLYEQAGGSLSWPFFVVLVFWLVVLFIGFSLYARLNATAIAAFLVGALTVAGAIFLILDMHQPYSGLMQISSAPIKNALTQIGR